MKGKVGEPPRRTGRIAWAAVVLGTVAATAVVVAGCDRPAVGPAADAGPIHLEFSVDPDSFASGGVSTATIRLVNALERDTTVTVNIGCLAFLTTRKSDEPQALEGTAFACPAVVTHFDVPAGDTLMVQHRIEAFLAEDPDEPAPSGRDVLEADFDVEGFLAPRAALEIEE